MGRSLIIIGAVIAGLATGCYAQMNGYQSQIFERHDKPGGTLYGLAAEGLPFLTVTCTPWAVRAKSQGYARFGTNPAPTKPATSSSCPYNAPG